MIAQNRAPPYRSFRNGNANSETDDSRAGRCLCGRFFAWVNEWAKRAVVSGQRAVRAARRFCVGEREAILEPPLFQNRARRLAKGKLNGAIAEEALIFQKTERKNDAGERVNKAADGHAACRGRCFLLGSRGGIDAQRRSSAFAVFCTCVRRAASSGFRDSSRR